MQQQIVKCIVAMELIFKSRAINDFQLVESTTTNMYRPASIELSISLAVISSGTLKYGG